MSGDGVPGGSFETSYIVVNNGNVIFARPDYNEDPYLSSTLANGSLANPYPVLAPEAASNSSERRRPEQRGQLRHGLQPQL